MVVGVAANRMEWSGGEECSVLDSTRLDWIGLVVCTIIVLHCTVVHWRRVGKVTTAVTQMGLELLHRNEPQRTFFFNFR